MKTPQIIDVDHGTPETTLAITPSPQMEALTTTRPPEIVLEEARAAAAALKQVIDSKPKKVTFNGETYLENEDWLTVARFYGVTSRIRSTKFVEFGDDEHKVVGFEAIAEAYSVQNGDVISMAESMCLSDERNWKGKPLFQLRSMAQTRASSRVLRQVFGWVVVLAGYKATPAEEMVEKSNAVYCENCGEDIGPFTRKNNGKTEVIPAHKVVARSKIEFQGKLICGPCQSAIEKEKKNGQIATKPAEQSMEITDEDVPF